jgi:hypothetical protein
MALTLGTNCGFVTSTPSGDPGASLSITDNNAFGIKDTSPATAIKITEIGFWRDPSSSAGETTFDVGIYTDDAGNVEPQTVVGSLSTGNTTSTEDWIAVTGLNISISSSTVYWICVACSASPATYTNITGTGTATYIKDSGNTSLPDPTWDIGSSSKDTSSLMSVYAVWEAAPGAASTTAINIGDAWKSVSAVKVNVGDAWKTVASAKVNVGDAWKAVDIS